MAGQWNELASPFGTPLLRYEWLAAYAETLGHPDQLRIIVNDAQGEITGIAPLFMTTFSWKRLELLGQRFHNKPMGFIYKNNDSLQELIDAIVQLKMPLLFWRLRTDSPEIGKLGQLRGWKCFVRSDKGPLFLDVQTDWNTFQGGMTSDHIGDLRQKRSLLEKQGSVSIDMLSPDRKSVDDYFEEILRIETAGWKGETRAPMPHHRLKLFYYTYCKEAASLGILRLCFLKVNNEAIAVQIAVEYSNRFWLLKMWHDKKWAGYSPGNLLTHETIRYTFEHKLKGYEFLGDDEQWGCKWTQKTRPQVNFRSYPYHSLRGISTFSRDALSSAFLKLTSNS